MSDSVILREKRDEQRISLIAAKRAQRVAAMTAGNFGKGVDRAFIEEMKAIKSATATAERAADRQRGKDLKAMNRVLAGVELDEHRRAERELASLKQTWREQSDGRARREADLVAQLAAADATTPEETGLAAAQCFLGEDPQRGRRILLQQRQMARWTQQAAAERKAAVDEVASHAGDYKAFIDRVDVVRDALEAEETGRRVDANWSQRRTNEALAAEKVAERAAAEAAERAAADAELAHNRQDAFLQEVPRPGDKSSFKGLSKAEVRSILDANSATNGARAREIEEGRREDRRFVAQSKALNRIIAGMEIEEHKKRHEEAQSLKADLIAQREAARAREAESAANARGEIGAGFFARFGTSC